MLKLSFSQIKLYKSYPLDYFYRYVQRLPEKDTETKWCDFGLGVHEVLEDYYSGKNNDYRSNTIKAYDKYKLKGRMKLEDFKKNILNGIKLAWKTTDLEEEMFVDVYDDVGFVGYIDVLDKEKHTILDWKTGTYTKDKEDDYKSQLLCYAWMYHRKYNIVPSECCLYFTKQSKLIPFTFTLEQINQFENYVKKIAQEIKYKRINHTKAEQWGHELGFFSGYHYLENLPTLKFLIEIRNSFCYLGGSTSPLLLQGLKKNFAVDHQSKFFMQKKVLERYGKTKFYDDIGTVYLFNERQKKFPLGMLNDVKQQLKEYAEYKNSKHEVTVVDLRDKKILNKKLGIMPNKLQGGIVLRDYQLNAVYAFIVNQGIGTLEIGTGGGKSFLTAEVIRRLDTPTLWIINQKELLYQTKEAFEKSLGIPIGVIGDSKIDFQNVTVATVQTLAKKVKDMNSEMLAYLAGINLVVIDECLYGNTKIRMGDGTEKTIKEIYECKEEQYVMSYNEDKQIFESKKVIRKMKNSMNDKWHSFKVKDELGDEHKIIVTDNHKIWTSDGYKQVKDLNSNDILKVYLEPIKFKCKYCDKFFTGKPYSKHILIHKNPEACSNGGKAATKILKEKLKNKKFHKKYCASIKKGISVAQKSEHYWEAYKKMGEGRRGKNNPIFNSPETILNMIKTKQKQFAAKTFDEQQKQIKRFMNSPGGQCKGPTKCEKIIMDMKIDNLEYTGNGRKIYKFNNWKGDVKKRKFKVPDFKVKNEEKVIEVGDFEYWHNKKETNEVIKNYENIGVKCLYLDEKEIFNDYELSKKKIEKFCYNHTARLIKKQKQNGFIDKEIAKYKYNIEVEDNHNYIANKILVSNCHNSSCTTYEEVFKALSNTKYRLGTTATAFREDKQERRMYALTGSIVCKIDSEELIKKGFLMKPIIKFFKVKESNVTKINYALLSTEERHSAKDSEYAREYEEGIVYNPERNEFIKEFVGKEVNSKILIIVKSIEHGELLNMNIEDSLFIHGSLNKKVRKEYFDILKSPKPCVVIATIKIASEGLDVPDLNILINAAANKSDNRTVQALGRILRKHESKTQATYIDFIDKSNHGAQHSWQRVKAFKAQGHKVSIIDIK